MRQRFTRVVIEVDETQRDTITYVRLASLGEEAMIALAYGGADTITPFSDWPSGPFAEFWQRGGGQFVFGDPISLPFASLLPDGSSRIAQYFTRVVFFLEPSSGQIELAPLGLWDAARTQLTAPVVQHTIR
jgi:hypothetical protein